jgi:hypothetical protein
MDQLFDERVIRFTGAVLAAIMVASAIRAIIESQRRRVGNISHRILRHRRYRTNLRFPALYPFINTNTTDTTTTNDSDHLEFDTHDLSDELQNINETQPSIDESNNIFYISYDENDQLYKLLTIVDSTLYVVHAMLVHRSDLSSTDTLSYNGLACSDRTIDITRFVKTWLGKNMNHLYYYNQRMKWIQLLNMSTSISSSSSSSSSLASFFDNYEDYIIIITYKIKDALHLITNELNEEIKIAEFI